MQIISKEILKQFAKQGSKKGIKEGKKKVAEKEIRILNRGSTAKRQPST